MDTQSRSVQELFSSIPLPYERSLSYLTLGLDSYWRREAAHTALRRSGGIWMDLCCGTGNMCRLLAEGGREDRTVIGVDFSLPRVKQAAKVVRGRGIHFVVADVDALPFREGQFDGVTIAYGLRNLNTNRSVLTRRLHAVCALLSRGGSLVSVETSQPWFGPLRAAMHWYARTVLRKLGTALSKADAAHAYLAHTVPRFYPASTLSRIMREAGFDQVDFYHLTFGFSAVHCARRLW